MTDSAGGGVDAAAPDGVAILDGDVFSSVNPTFAALHGFDRPDDLVGEPWRDRFHADDRARLDREILPATKRHGEWRGEVRGLRRDGESVSQELSLSAIDDETVVCVARDVTGRRERDLEHQFLRSVVDALDDVFYVIDEDGDAFMLNDRLLEVTGYGEEEVSGVAGEVFIPPEQHDYVPGLWNDITELEDQQVVLDILTKDGRRVPHEFHGVTVVDEETGDAYRCGIARDITERIEREQRLERQRDELRTLNRINELLLTITRELVETPSRPTVERTVCQRLATSGLYRFAWIGARGSGGTDVDFRTGVGDDGEPFEDLADVDAGESSRRVARSAIESGGIEIAGTLSGESGTELGSTDAATGEPGSIAAIPLKHGDVVYGVLVVCAARLTAYSVLEQAGFEVLGETVGFVVNAIENRRLLFADSVVELELEVEDRSLFLVAASDRLDCRLAVEGYVATGPDQWLLYVSVDGATVDRIEEMAADVPGIDGVRPVDGDGDAPIVEFSIVGGSLLQTLSQIGATVRSGTVDDGVGRFVVEAPRSADVRSVVERITATYPETTLVARRERDRPVQGAERFSRRTVEDLTPRQRQVLEVAYRTGYYDWPRKSTAETVADAIGIAPATFHGHLRKGQRKLLTGLFDDG